MSLKNTLSDFFNVNQVKDAVFRLVEAKLELKKLEILEKVEEVLADMLLRVIFFILAFVAFIFLLILGAWGVNVWLGEPWGYVSVLTLLVLKLFAFYFFKDSCRMIIRKIIQKEIDRIAE
jgi:hypothetical protein